MPIETPTKIGLISKALLRLGEKPLNALNDNRYGATVGGNLFEQLYEVELQSNRWRFAMTKGALSIVNAEPLNEWVRAFRLPPDMLLPIGVFPPVPYEIYADRIYTDANTVEIDYMFKPEISELPAYFAELIVCALARDMAMPITQKESLYEIMKERYKAARNLALYADAQGRPAREIIDAPFVAVR